MENLLATAIIRTSFGLKGHLKLNLFSDDYKHLKKIKTVLVKKDNKSYNLDIDEIKKQGDNILIKFKNIDTCEDAKLLNGFTIYIKREEASKLEEGEVYLSDLIGCSILLNNKKVGKVLSYFEGAQAPLLEVKTETKIVLIPYMAVYIGEVDLERKTLELLEKDLLL